MLQIVKPRLWAVQEYRLLRAAELPQGAGNQRDGFMPRMEAPFQRVAFPNNPTVRKNHYWHELTGTHGRTWLAHEYRAFYHRTVTEAANNDAGLISE